MKSVFSHALRRRPAPQIGGSGVSRYAASLFGSYILAVWR
ncbi:hypothetical protein SMNI109538_15025 [Smaragdicoccus niigatensis]